MIFTPQKSRTADQHGCNVQQSLEIKTCEGLLAPSRFKAIEPDCLAPVQLKAKEYLKTLEAILRSAHLKALT
jgi:hypothetical protein